jgi:uncharacterized RDD family membrane protein YckC
MKTWRLRVQGVDGGPLSRRQAVVRFFASLLSLAPAGLGYLWILVDKDQRAWHDQLSNTVVVHLPKPKRGREPPQTDAASD